jgi:hypothetical protein
LIRTHQRAVGLLLVARENTPDGQDQEIVQQMDPFFFGEGAALPPTSYPKRARVNLISARYTIRG